MQDERPEIHVEEPKVDDQPDALLHEVAPVETVQVQPMAASNGFAN